MHQENQPQSSSASTPFTIPQEEPNSITDTMMMNMPVASSSMMMPNTSGVNSLPPTASAHAAGPSIYQGPGAVSVPTASLYVGELSPEVNESMLFELFSQIGPVASIRVCRDAVTRRSLGYAYVNFHSILDGERAMDSLNYTPIKGQPCRIMWSQRDPSLRRSGHGNVFIKDLEKSIDNKALHDTFSAFGNILSCKVVTDENNESKGYGFVHFETQESADMAIEKVNGMLLNEKKVFVGHHISRRERVSKKEESKAHFTNVYVKNLDLSVDDHEFRALFESFGDITSAIIVRQDGHNHQQHDLDHQQLSDESSAHVDPATGSSRGFGFVNFASHSSAIAAVNALNGIMFQGKELTVCRAQTKAERAEELRRQFEALRQERLAKYQGVNLYVKNMDESVDDQLLRDEFLPFGNIVSCKVMRDEKDHSKGFGFVCFSTPEEAIKAQAEMNGKLIAGKPIFVAMAQRKEERRMALESQFSQRLQYLRAGIHPPTGMPHHPAQMVPGLFYSQHPTMMPTARLPPYHGIPQQILYSSASRRFSTRQPVVPGMLPHASASQMFRNNNHNSNQTNGAEMMMSPQQPSHSYTQQQPFRRQYNRSKQNGGGNVSPPPSSVVSQGGVVGHNFNRRVNSGSPSSFQKAPRSFRKQHYHHQSGPHSGNDFGMSNNTVSGYHHHQPSSSVLVQALANASSETQKSMIGELLYPMVESREPAYAAKITGMLLDMNNSDLLQLLEYPEILASKVTEAAELLLTSGRE